MSPCRGSVVFIWVFCHHSFPCSTLWHQCPGVCAWLHGAGLETANLHRRCWHHRILCGLPWGHRWRSREVAWSQHKGRQWEGLQGEHMWNTKYKWVLKAWAKFWLHVCLTAGVRPEGESEVPVPSASSQHGRCRHPIHAQWHLPVWGVDHRCARLGRHF